MAALKGALAALVFLAQAAKLSDSASAATFEDVYGWVYRTGREVAINMPAAACLGLKTPQSVFERAWLGLDSRIHAIAVGEDKKNPFVLISVLHDLRSNYFGSFFLSGKDGRLLGVCDSPHVNASFVAVKDGSLDAKFESENTYLLERLGQRWKLDRFVPVERDYP